jgi:hypothetical protein
MSTQFHIVQNYLRSWFWQFAGFPIRCFGLGLFGLDRFLWQRHPLAKKIPESWQEILTEVNRDAPFFKAVPYRKSDSSDLSKEQQLLKVALAVTNLHYYDSNLEAYGRTVEEIGSYLKHESITNRAGVEGSTIWPEYLHAKATVESLSGHPGMAACSNSQAQLSSQVRREELMATEYEGCTMCCRIESFTDNKEYLLSTQERYLVNAIDTQLNDFSERLGTFVPDSDNPVLKEDNTLNQQHMISFRVAMMRCKAQMYTENPDIAIIDDNIKLARNHRLLMNISSMNNFEIGSYDFAISFYDFILSYKRRNPKNETYDLDKSRAILKAWFNCSIVLTLSLPLRVSSLLLANTLTWSAMKIESLLKPPSGAITKTWVG